MTYFSRSQHGGAGCSENCKMCLCFFPLESIPISLLLNTVLCKILHHFYCQQEVKGSGHADSLFVTIPGKWGTQRRVHSEGRLIPSLMMTASIKSLI